MFALPPVVPKPLENNIPKSSVEAGVPLAPWFNSKILSFKAVFVVVSKITSPLSVTPPLTVSSPATVKS